MDSLLITQIKCQLITHQLTCPTDDSWEDDGPTSPSVVVAKTLLGQVEDLQRTLPPHLRSESPFLPPFMRCLPSNRQVPGAAQFYINSTKLTIQASVLSRPIAQDHGYVAQLRRSRDAEATLNTIESWLATFFEMPECVWIGISVDIFAQFMHCLVVLFKLTTLETLGWDLEEVRRRADVFEILDRAAETVDRVPARLGIMDARGPRRGLLFKTSYLFRAIKALFMAEMGPRKQQQQQQQSLLAAQDGSVGSGGDGYVSDEFLMSLWDEPWFSDILRPF